MKTSAFSHLAKKTSKHGVQSFIYLHIVIPLNKKFRSEPVLNRPHVRRQLQFYALRLNYTDQVQTTIEVENTAATRFLRKLQPRWIPTKELSQRSFNQKTLWNTSVFDSIGTDVTLKLEPKSRVLKPEQTSSQARQLTILCQKENGENLMIEVTKTEMKTAMVIQELWCKGLCEANCSTFRFRGMVQSGTKNKAE